MDNIANLEMLALECGIFTQTRKFIHDPNFKIWSGSSRPGKHHYGDGGLLQHTNENAIIGFSIIQKYKNIKPFSKLEEVEFFVSNLFHDFGKIDDYVKGSDGKWKATDHKNKIHHICRSVLRFVDANREMGFPKEFEDKVIHNILSHHQFKEWRSPVEPQSRVAWLLHLSDNLSAKLFESNVE